MDHKNQKFKKKYKGMSEELAAARERLATIDAAHARELDQTLTACEERVRASEDLAAHYRTEYEKQVAENQTLRKDHADENRQMQASLAVSQEENRELRVEVDQQRAELVVADEKVADMSALFESVKKSMTKRELEKLSVIENRKMIANALPRPRRT